MLQFSAAGVINNLGNMTSCFIIALNWSWAASYLSVGLLVTFNEDVIAKKTRSLETIQTQTASKYFCKRAQMCTQMCCSCKSKRGLLQKCVFYVCNVLWCAKNGPARKHLWSLRCVQGHIKELFFSVSCINNLRYINTNRMR